MEKSRVSKSIIWHIFQFYITYTALIINLDNYTYISFKNGFNPTICAYVQPQFDSVATDTNHRGKERVMMTCWQMLSPVHIWKLRPATLLCRGLKGRQGNELERRVKKKKPQGPCRLVMSTRRQHSTWYELEVSDLSIVAEHQCGIQYPQPECYLAVSES